MQNKSETDCVLDPSVQFSFDSLHQVITENQVITANQVIMANQASTSDKYKYILTVKWIYITVAFSQALSINYFKADK